LPSASAHRPTPKGKVGPQFLAASTRSWLHRPDRAKRSLRFWHRSTACFDKRSKTTCRMKRRSFYISPLKALSNDIHRNLQVPLEEIRAAALAAGLARSPSAWAVRTGDTPQSERQSHGPQSAAHSSERRPESLYLLLTSAESP